VTTTENDLAIDTGTSEAARICKSTQGHGMSLDNSRHGETTRCQRTAAYPTDRHRVRTADRPVLPPAPTIGSGLTRKPRRQYKFQQMTIHYHHSFRFVESKVTNSPTLPIPCFRGWRNFFPLADPPTQDCLGKWIYNRSKFLSNHSFMHHHLLITS
jgi:hypothetical protein